ncbi:spermatogenesis-associated protein 6-like isoform X3 [Dreissena polymorpha]|uniref:spermatogenesis-associated protein 6-like isoform X3 n=1 Tax=Dreissena polymorpha TaxID=45954 RepID=UPI0022648E43|nr:spermatogenesis-associated protein 6-like isoform X3 [Dreissena polymorpha]
MPRRALRCVVDLNIERVSAPGVWLPSKEDCYLSISVFGQYRNTRNVTSVFPFIFYEPFRFEKTYYTALDPQDVAEFLEDELVIIELLQYSDYSDGAVRLASFSTSAREFLFPYPSLCPSYTSSCREVLLSRTIAFPGISPKLEFTTGTVIKESRSPELDALEDALEEEKIARKARSRSRSRGRSVTRSRSLSRTRTYSPEGLHITITSGAYSSDSEDSEGYDSDPSYMRPTISSIFRSRSKSGLDKSLIGRTPGAPPAKGQKVKKSCGRSRSRSRSRPSSALSGYVSDEPVSYTPRQYVKEVIRDGDDALPVYSTKYVSDDDDAEVEALTSPTSYLPPPRPRSVSPYIYKPSYSTRFSGLTASERLEIELALERARARARARAIIARSRSPSPVRYTPILDGTIDDLALETSIAKNRSWVHLDAEQYWTQRAAELTGTSHRDVFNNNMKTLYSGLLRKAEKQHKKSQRK